MASNKDSNGRNLKDYEYQMPDIMGHADVTTTMNIYNEIQESKKQSAFAELQNKLKIC